MSGDPAIHHTSGLLGSGGPSEGASSLVVILVGAPGSGKSTFCDDVMAAARRPWVRVCQDIIANGKQGTKAQCITSASAALEEGKSVFIDRCNLEQAQRADFVRLRKVQVDVHAVVLDLPAQLCISRSVKRTGHEGKLQGGRAAMVVNRMLQKKELPNLSEGFSRITFCQNERDVKEAVNAYSQLGPSDILSAGVFRQKNQEAKVQLGIMKFLKKIDKSDFDASGKDSTPVGNLPLDTASMQTSVTSTCSMELEKNKEDLRSSNSNCQSQRSLTGDSSMDFVHTLAFPSISTADFQFDLKLASEIIVDCVSDFLRKFDNIRLVLVDLSEKSKILSLVRERSANKHIDSSKFFTFVGDITQLHSRGNLRCNVIANAANWRLKPGGGGVNAAIFKAAGESLQTATKKCADILSPGSSVVVPLPSNSPLHAREGVTHVIHVVGANMNPQRPNCLNNDYVEGCKVLRNAYSSLFANFASILENQSKTDSKRHVFAASGASKDKNIVANDDHGHTPSNESPSNLMKRSWGAWAQVLYEKAMNPEKHKNVVMEKSDDYVVLTDMYPKAKKHILVVSRLQGLDSLSDVREEHLPLLKKMHSAGLKWTQMFLNEDASLMFRLGYHSVPSMRQLHLHVISQDFDSPSLRNKKHWNSFNTSFFRDSTDLIQELEEKHGVADINGNESLLKMELRCHRCRSAHPNIPRLKSHIALCKASLPAWLLHNDRLVSALPRC
ncbi:transcription factor bHLH140 isoform X2 [Curcuma longa]|uniref:transcription factor bHLH140 isoform X2 n=1 Tax=Curcuma longa TaxID=136217 RepID=UPI003D9DC9FF